MPGQVRRHSRLAAVIIATTVLLWWIYSRPIPAVGKAGLRKSSSWKGQPLPKGWSLTGGGEAEREGDLHWKRPPELRKIVALVFYGRAATVSILECYLRRNLVTHGGVLDEVIFLSRTSNKKDIEYLDILVAKEPLYRKQEVETLGFDYSVAYNNLDDDVMYIKIDDDIVFIEDSTLPTIAREKWEHPELYLVGANVVNQMLLIWVHHRMGVNQGYFPEYTQEWAQGIANAYRRAVTPVEEEAWKRVAIKNNISGPGASDPSRQPITGGSSFYDTYPLADWRVSDLPAWEGPPDFEMPLIDGFPKPHHRWLPVPLGNLTDETPMKRVSYGPFAEAMFGWTMALQTHYSFLAHLERNDLWRYRFRQWDNAYERFSINLIAIMGRDINAAKPFPNDDERHLSETMPQKFKRRAVMDGRGLAVHYAFAGQKAGLDTTDVLDRYRAFAQENICVKPMA